VRETTHRRDGLFSGIVLSGCIVLDHRSVLGVNALTNSVDLLIDLSSMMVTFLTSSSHSKLDSTWMPGSDTSNLSQTLVSLARKLLRVPSASHTLVTFALGDTNSIDHLIVGKNVLNGNRFLEALASPFDLLSNSATVKLNFHQMGLLLSSSHQLHLGMGEYSDDGTVLLHLSQVLLDFFLADWVLPLLGVLSEGLLLGLIPVLVESSSTIFAEMLSKDGLEDAQTLRCLDVTHDTNHDHRRCLEDGNSFDNLFLVSF